MRSESLPWKEEIRELEKKRQSKDGWRWKETVKKSVLDYTAEELKLFFMISKVISDTVIS